MICGNYLWLAAPFSLTRQTLTNHCVGSKLPPPPTITVIVWEREREKKIPFHFFLAVSFIFRPTKSDATQLLPVWGGTQSLCDRQWVKVEQVHDESCADSVVSSPSSGMCATKVLNGDGSLSCFNLCHWVHSATTPARWRTFRVWFI